MEEDKKEEAQKEEKASAELEAQDTPASVQEPSESEEELTPEQINWRKFREQRAREREEAKQQAAQAEQERQAREALQRFISENLAKQGAQVQLTPAQQEQIIADLPDDEIPTGGEIKGYIQRQIERGVQEALQRTKSEQERQKLPTQVRSQLKDFDEVCSQENIDYLQYKAPYLAESLSARLKNPENVRFEDLAALYDAVLQVVPSASEKKTPAQVQDPQKPRSLSHPIANASRDIAPRSLSAKQREEEYQRMVALAKGLA